MIMVPFRIRISARIRTSQFGQALLLPRQQSVTLKASSTMLDRRWTAGAVLTITVLVLQAAAGEIVATSLGRIQIPTLLSLIGQAQLLPRQQSVTLKAMSTMLDRRCTVGRTVFTITALVLQAAAGEIVATNCLASAGAGVTPTKCSTPSLF